MGALMCCFKKPDQIVIKSPCPWIGCKCYFENKRCPCWDTLYYQKNKSDYCYNVKHYDAF